ncbi:MAG: DUF4870 domain-containing protein [Acidobacteriota bacterium]
MDELNPTPVVDPADAEQNMVMGVLAYVLFLIPLLAAKESKFAMYHANQGLNLFIFSIAVMILGTFIPLLGWFLILPIGSLACFVFFILGIVNAVKKEMKPLPLIGKFEILK